MKTREATITNTEDNTEEAVTLFVIESAEDLERIFDMAEEAAESAESAEDSE